MKNIENNAIISVANAEANIAPSEVSGGFYKKNGSFYITYHESKKSEMGASRVMIKAENGIVTMRRMGDYSTVMHYDINTETELLYKTPYGDMPMKIKTDEIINDLSDTGGVLFLKYRLIAGGETTNNEIVLRVKLIEKRNDI